ncbi:glycosyl hydrolase family protein [Naegleria gruberi]|uniref:Mannosyl-oligosaccharide glucosidase n=1 Tax=Naegleria gruberi TaxID=5762 RepID=D2VA12_NAEGR|nr:glycosyl hydrolase family protein [Naegleria gruberi]EFC46349.1 glycosyl hydrolase family protein [Naegleria gruberi]|eukprot:XP_002679093.1 glycosyl hydrolase family protein [Naegleria gruberi strain NEG-M]
MTTRMILGTANHHQLNTCSVSSSPPMSRFFYSLLLLCFISTLMITSQIVMGNELETNNCIHRSDPVFQTTLYNHTMKWGTYRPQVIFGMKTRNPKSVITGLMWNRADTWDGVNKMRHNSNMDFNNVVYGWNRHDGQNFAMQTIKDHENSLQIETRMMKHVSENTFVPSVNEKGGDWTVRLIGKELKQMKTKQAMSVCFYIALENDGEGSFRISGIQGSKKQGLPSNLPVIIRGNSGDIGDFSMYFTSNEKSQVDEHANFYFYGVKRTPSDVWKIGDEVKEMFSSQMKKSFQQMIEDQQERRQKGLPEQKDYPIPIATLPNFIEEDSNILVIQKFFYAPFDLNVAFLSHEQHPDIFSNFQIKQHGSDHIDNFDNNIKQLKTCFEQKFQETFNLKEKNLKEDEKEMTMYALSNLVGGIGYYYGDSYHQKGNLQEIRTIEPYALFTACPCRSFFPRGFLWDEGFHSLLIQKWNKQIAKDIINNWFNVMDKSTGWIPREQILGAEARTRVPEQFQVQHDTHANPPMLFLAVLELLKNHARNHQIELDLDATQRVASLSESEAMVSFLNQVYPNMKKNYEWYLSTQKGKIPNSYRWRGRTPGHTLSSGLDDYPRGNVEPSDDERHLDLYCWIYMMTDTMNKINNIIFKKDDPVLVERLKTLKSNIKTQHYNKNIEWFSDYAGKPVGNDTRPEFSPHIGYISLFPFLFDVPDFEQEPKLLQHALDTIIRDKLWTVHGLTSLSQTDPMFGTKENYWRGPIWINLNYLTLRALHNCKQKSARCGEVYNALRTNIIQTLYNEWRRSRTLYEQYNAQTGKGQGAHPFTGWSALITLIMGEIYE